MTAEQTYSRAKALSYIIWTVVLILIADQWLKFYIKTHFQLGEEISVFGDWFKLHFTENPGMAFGLSLGGSAGKIVLTVFRMIASGAIIYFLGTLIKEKAKLGLIILVSCVLAGALGNIIDSLFYGLIFNESGYHSVATLFPKEGGYAPMFMGKVVDMLYFPLIDTYLPDWVPFIGGDRFQFFRPVFNIADAAISTGVALIIAFRKSLFIEQHFNKDEVPEHQDNEISDESLTDKGTIS